MSSLIATCVVIVTLCLVVGVWAFSLVCLSYAKIAKSMISMLELYKPMLEGITSQIQGQLFKESLGNDEY